MRSRSAAGEPYGTRSSSCRLTPQAPSCGEPAHRVDRVQRLPGGAAERVAAGVSDGPEPEGEAVLGAGREVSAVIQRRIAQFGGRAGIIFRPCVRRSASMSARRRSRRSPSTRRAPCSPARRSGYPLSMPRPGWAEQDPGGLVARDASRRSPRWTVDEVAGIGLSGQMHGLVALDAAGAVIRPAILWNDGRTAAECAEIEQRVGLDELIARTGNRALTGFTAPKLLWLRRHEPDAYRAHRADRAAEGLRAPAALRRARDRRRRRVRHAAARRRATALERRGAASARARSAPGCRALWSRRRSRAPRATACPSPPARATRPRARSASASTGPGPLSIALGTSGVVFAALPGFAADERARVHAFCHAVPGGWHAMGVMLSAGRLAALAARRRRARHRLRRADRGGRGAGSRAPRA